MYTVDEYERRRRKEAMKKIGTYSAQAQSWADESTAAIDNEYRTGVQSLNDSYRQAKKETSVSYRSLFDANAVDELVRKREAYERAANMGHWHSGLSSGIQSSIQRQRRQNDDRFTEQKRASMKSLDTQYQSAIKGFDTWRESEKKRVLEEVKKGIDDITSFYNKQADEDIARYGEERKAAQTSAFEAYVQRDASTDIEVPTVTLRTVQSPKPDPKSMLLNTVADEMEKRTREGMTAAWNTVMKGYRDKVLTRTQMNDILRENGILSPSQQEYYMDSAGDFRYDFSLSYDELRQMAIEQRRDEISPSSVDTTFIRRFFEDHNAMADNLSALNFDNASELANSEAKRKISLQKRGVAVLRFLEEHRSNLGEDQYKALVQAVNKAMDGQKQMLNSFRSFASAAEEYASKQTFDDRTLNVDDIQQMSLEELKEKLAETERPNEDIKPLEARIREIDRALTSIPGTARNQKARERLKELKAEKRALQDEINEMIPSAVAYTTTDGKNVTWRQLYDAKKWQEEFDALYAELSSQKDWDTYSVYDRSVAGKDVLYHTANMSQEQKNKLAKADVALAVAGYVDGVTNPIHAGRSLAMKKKYSDATVNAFLSEKEKQIYNYLYATEGAKAAEEWKTSFLSVLKDRRTTGDLAVVQDFTQKNAATAALASLASVPTSLMSGAEYVVDAAKYLATGDMDTNMLSQATSTIRGAVTQKYDWEIEALNNWDAFDFLYNTTMSLADSAATIPLGGWGGAAVLGLSAAASATNEALERGMDDKHAFWSGIAAGAFETVFEKVSIGEFKTVKEGITAGLKDAVKQVGGVMLKNASEETLTEIANTLYDISANEDFSVYETSIRAKMAQGMSRDEAERKAAIEIGVRVGEAAASGMLMGVGFGTAASAGGYSNTKSVGKALRAEGLDAVLIELGQMLDKGTAAKQFAAELASKSKVSDAEIGKLAGLIDEQLQRETAAQPETAGQTTEKAGQAETVSDPMADDLVALFKAGMEGRKYTPQTQELALHVDNPEAQGYNTGEVPDGQPAALSSDPAVAELLERFKAGMEGRKYEPKNVQQEGDLTSVSLRFMSNRDTFYRNMEKVEALDGYEDVVCHADPYSFVFQDPDTGETLQELSAESLAKQIRESGKYNGGPIRLIACESGAVENGIAQQLADKLGVEVLAPTKMVFVDKEGKMVVASDKNDAYTLLKRLNKQWDSSGWTVFKPRR